MKQPTNKMNPVFKLLLAGCILPFGLSAQTKDSTTLTNASLQNVVAYAIKHQPLVEQAKIDEQITDNTIKSKLSTLR